MLEKFKGLGLAGQVAVTLIFMTLIGVVGWLYFPKIGPKREQKVEKLEQLDKLNAENQKGLNLEKKLPELEREIASREAQLEELKTIIPPVRRDSEIVQKLENLAVRSRLGIKQILPNRPRKKEFYDEYPLAIDVQANYHDLGKFFDRMAHLPRIFNVQGVNIRQSTAAGPNGGPSPYSIEASFTAVTFIYREEAPAAPAAKKKDAGPDKEDEVK
jgi:Tfp pilus assembly protein PilO